MKNVPIAFPVDFDKNECGPIHLGRLYLGKNQHFVCDLRISGRGAVSEKHTVYQGEGGYVWHQGCQCDRCQQKYWQFLAEQTQSCGKQSPENWPTQAETEAK